MDAATLRQAMGNVSGVNYEAYVDGFNNAMRAAGITTALRAAHWCAQIGHESVGLKYMSEIWGPTPTQRGYEGRADLGNTQVGDGFRFRGSGPIQLTGRNNFRAFTRWANAQGHTTINFELEPNKVRAVPKWGFLAASWYWTVARPQLNSLCDQDNVEAVTRAINGGTNGLQDRKNRLARCKALGNRLLPSAEASTSTKPKPLTPTPGHRGDPLFLPRLLRQWGVTVKEMNGWDQRGEGDFTDIIGVMCHHTAGANTSAEYIARNPNLGNGLSSQIHLGRDGVVTLCGVGVAWHAGSDEARTPAWAKGQVQIKTRHQNKWQSLGNAKMIGIEAVNAGDGSQDWPEKQVDAYARVVAAILWYLGLPLDRCIAHKEFAPSRKIDPNFDMTSFRARVKKHLDNPPTSKEDDMTPDQAKKLDHIYNQLTGSFKEGEFPGFDTDALYATAYKKGFKKLTLMEAAAVIVKTQILMTDQLVGFEKDQKGPKFTGWNADDIRAKVAEKRKAGIGLTQQEILQDLQDELTKFTKIIKEKK